MNLTRTLFFALGLLGFASVAPASDFLSLHQGAGACTACHEGKNDALSIPGPRGSVTEVRGEDREMLESIVRDTASTPASSAVLHIGQNLRCSACHGENALSGSPVENAACEGCHGSQSTIALKTNAPSGNPHQSHQGAIACTICHRGHESTKNYCLECHPAMTRPMPEHHLKSGENE